jgi:uncharacterized protein (DUF1697 family)
MPVVISLLRAVNVGGHNKIKMDDLRRLCASLHLKDVQTYVQSGNVVFRTEARDLAELSTRIENRIQKDFGFRPSVMLRTSEDLRSVIARNPFAGRPDMEPGKLLVMFLANDPAAGAREKITAIKADPEELRLDGLELYIYFPNGMGRSKLSMGPVERILKTAWTGRNWNTVTKLLEIAEGLEHQNKPH